MKEYFKKSYTIEEIIRAITQDSLLAIEYLEKGDKEMATFFASGARQGFLFVMTCLVPKTDRWECMYEWLKKETLYNRVESLAVLGIGELYK